MVHTLSPAPERDAIREHGTTLISWGTGILLAIIGFPLLIPLIKLLLGLLYEVFIRYRY